MWKTVGAFFSTLGTRLMGAFATKKSGPMAYHRQRVEIVQALRAEGVNPFPHKFHITTSLQDFVDTYGPVLTEDGKVLEEQTVCVAGRVFMKRGRNYNVQYGDRNFQILANSKFHKAGLDDFLRAHEQIRRGDIIGVEGHPSRSKRGELSIVPTSVQLLAPCLHMRLYRMRFLDLIVNPESRPKFVTRTKIIKFLKNYLDALGILFERTIE